MPRKQTSSVNERVKFVAAMLEAAEGFSDRCSRFGISWKQGYQWTRRYEAGGVEGAGRSVEGSAFTSARSFADVVELLVAARRSTVQTGYIDDRSACPPVPG